MTGTWYTMAAHQCQLCGFVFVAVWIDGVVTESSFARCAKCGTRAMPIEVTAEVMRVLLIDAEFLEAPDADQE